jgi:SAM-dependent methyltransferase
MNANDLKPTERFSSRVDDYVKYRPAYPREVLDLLRMHAGFQPSWKIADVGCGTGISSGLFLENGNVVFGVEPNDDMRRAAEREFADQPRFHPVKGKAEATSLPDQSVDLVVAAQAFHWFDQAAFAAEASRILRQELGGYVLLMWNTRLIGSDPFAAEYDALLHRLGTDYSAVSHRSPVGLPELGQLFGAPFKRLTLPNWQIFDFDSLRGRVRSSSYTPSPGDPRYEPLYRELRAIFDRHQANGTIRFNYETELYLGKAPSQPRQ